jgi:3-oxoacyl-[acyl-carrier protein] reductase/(S)-1-phenylethanol dehydrogenase
VSLDGRTALVTGGSRGIGRSACIAFARAGADVVVHCHSARADAEAVADDVRTLGRRALVVHGDVTDEAAVAAMVDEVAAWSPVLHVLFNNAGIYPLGSLETVSVAEWERVLAVNVRGPFLVTRAALPLLKAAGGARVVNIGSVMALKGTPGAIHYVTSKMATIGFTRGLATELAPFGVTVNCIVPSMVDTETVARNYADWWDHIVADQIVDRPQQPDDLAGLLVFLASPTSEFLTGQTVVAAGGRVFL